MASLPDRAPGSDSNPDTDADSNPDEVRVFTARQVRTMEPSLPTAEAVAVRNRRIVEVGSLASMRPWLDRQPHVIDDTFAEQVLMPGFIDPHLHPSMARCSCRWSSPRRCRGICRGNTWRL